jgi:uncharacterized protein YggU (UPF0235/DUF167 family)
VYPTKPRSAEYALPDLVWRRSCRLGRSESGLGTGYEDLSGGYDMVVIGPFKFQHVWGPAGAVAIIGMEMMRRFTLTFDAMHGLLYLEPNSSFNVIDDGTQRVALVSLEVTAVPEANELVKAIANQIHIPQANVMVAATHTHSVPLFSYSGEHPNPREVEEIDLLRRGALSAVTEANEHLLPSHVAFARGKGWVNINNGEQAGSKTGYDSLGPSDKTLDVVRFETLSGAPIAMLVNYSTHAEVMFRSITKDGGYEVSGDLPGAVSHILETTPRTAPVVLFTAGAEADQLPLFKSLQNGGPLLAADEALPAGLFWMSRRGGSLHQSLS